MADYRYRKLLLRYKQTSRHYRQLIIVLCSVIAWLVILLVLAQNNTAQADEGKTITYQSVLVHPGDTLWGLADTYCNSDMNVEDYVNEIRRINNMKNSDLISGEYIILPTVHSLSADAV